MLVDTCAVCPLPWHVSFWKPEAVLGCWGLSPGPAFGLGVVWQQVADHRLLSGAGTLRLSSLPPFRWLLGLAWGGCSEGKQGTGLFQEPCRHPAGREDVSRVSLCKEQGDGRGRPGRAIGCGLLSPAPTLLGSSSSMGRAPHPVDGLVEKRGSPGLWDIIFSVQAAPLSSQISQTDPPVGEHGRAGDLNGDEPLLHSDLRSWSRGWATFPQTIVAGFSLRATGAGRRPPHLPWAWPSPVGGSLTWRGLRDGGSVLTQPLMSPPHTSVAPLGGPADPCPLLAASLWLLRRTPPPRG